MSITPVLTELTPGAWTAAGIVAALDAHFVSGGGATHFVREFTGTDAFVVGSLTDTTPQYSIRATAASVITIEIEPGGTLTNAGNASTRPTGASADNSGALTLTLGTMGAGSALWVSEFDDAFSVLITGTTGVNWQPGFHVGRDISPMIPAVDEPLGRDGLVCYIGTPNVTATTGWIGYSTFGVSGRIHVATGIWLTPSTVSSITVTAAWDVGATFGFVRPCPMVVTTTTAPHYPIGISKYLYLVGTGRAPTTRIDQDNLTDQAFIHGGAPGVTTVNPIVIPWLRGVVP